MTPEQRRVTLAVCLVVGMSLLMAAGLTFLVTPMARDLGLGQASVEDILAMPSVAALIMVFSAGQLGDRLGARSALLIASTVFSLGALLLVTASSEVPVQFGLALCGAAAVTIQIVGVSLLQQVTGRGPAQVMAFTTFGVVFPLAFLVIPVATARLVQVADWRIVPAVWVLAGVAMLAVTGLMLGPGERVTSAGEWVTPLLAGVAFAGAARAIAEVDDLGPHPGVVGTAVLVACAAGIACVLATRRNPGASFSTRPIRAHQLPILLLVVALVSLSGLLTYVSIAVEYLYDMTPFEASIAIIPAQIGAIVGAKVLAKRAIERWGGMQAARVLLLGLAAATMPLALLQVGTPLWLLTGLATLFSFLWMGVLTVLNTEVMRRAPREQTGAVSAFRTAASSLGGAIGVGVLGTIVIANLPVEAGVDAVSLEELTGLTNSLRLDGLLSAVIVLVGWSVLATAGRTPDVVPATR